jgi:sugar/nucleoside kinase (ribokinase family)
MSAPRFDVLGIGNAIVDILASTEEDFLVRENLVKSSMRLIDAAEAERLYDHMGPAVETSGGSAGNTVAGVASFGGKAAFAGKVASWAASTGTTCTRSAFTSRRNRWRHRRPRPAR